MGEQGVQYFLELGDEQLLTDSSTFALESKESWGIVSVSHSNFCNGVFPRHSGSVISLAVSCIAGFCGLLVKVECGLEPQTQNRLWGLGEIFPGPHCSPKSMGYCWQL